MSRQPFMPLFFGDFLASTAEWTGEERGLYLLLLGYQWTGGSLPTDPRRLCLLVGWGEVIFNECWSKVSTKFHERDGRLYNLRLEEHREKARAISAKNAAAGRRGAEARWRDDGERHVSANGESMANAKDKGGVGHESANGGTHGNPSQSNPDQSSQPVDPVQAEVGVRGEEPCVESRRPRRVQTTQLDEPLDERMRKARRLLATVSDIDDKKLCNLLGLTYAEASEARRPAA